MARNGLVGLSRPPLDDEASAESQRRGGATRAPPQIRLEVLIEERLCLGRVEAVLEVGP
jgi:hypothetical protein